MAGSDHPHPGSSTLQGLLTAPEGFQWPEVALFLLLGKPSPWLSQEEMGKNQNTALCFQGQGYCPGRWRLLFL